MADERCKARWFRVLIPTLLILLAGPRSAATNDADGLRVTDYFVSHTSNEPFYTQQNLDPRVGEAGDAREARDDGAALPAERRHLEGAIRRERSARSRPNDDMFGTHDQ